MLGTVLVTSETSLLSSSGARFRFSKSPHPVCAKMCHHVTNFKMAEFTEVDNMCISKTDWKRWLNHGKDSFKNVEMFS